MKQGSKEPGKKNNFKENELSRKAKLMELI